MGRRRYYYDDYYYDRYCCGECCNRRCHTGAAVALIGLLFLSCRRY